MTGTEAVNYDNAVPLNEVSINNIIPVCIMFHSKQLNEEVYSFEVPKDFQHVKAENHGLALDWRMKTRKLFQELLGAGYTAVHLIPGKYTAKYIFVKHNTLQLGGHNI